MVYLSLLRWFANRFLIVLAAVLATPTAIGQVCAPPASLGTSPTSGFVNNYFAGNGNLSVGAVSLTLGAVDSRAPVTATLAIGDLLLVMQMQDASINTSNNSNYGGGTGSGAGTTSVGRSGLFEFVRITSVGASIGFTPALTNSYSQAAATVSTAQKTYQVIRVAQYSSVTANGITAPAWNGATGGVAVVDVQNTLTLGSSTVEGVTNRAFFLAGKGFRGGAGRQLVATGAQLTDYVTLSTSNFNASKAEGIVGTPFDVATITSLWGFKTTNPPAITQATPPATIEGYPGGSYARGAPGNAGGGGTDGGGGGNAENAGGGGGGNYGQGGIGGRPWNKPLLDTGGRGGAGYAGTLAFNRIFLGGGGGAGDTNNGTADAAAYPNNGIGCSLATGLCSSGAPGGGIVVIRARSVTGSGVIDIRGGHGYNVANDAGGGGGGGGSLILETSDGGSATVDASGGDGGNAWGAQAGGLGDRHGPGGAGGGGFVAFAPATLALSANVNGGEPGITLSGASRENYGSTGFIGGIANFQAPNVPGVPPAAKCYPNLSLSKTDGVTQLVSPSTNVYTFTVVNGGASASSGSTSVADKLSAGLSVVPGALVTSGANAAAWSCNAANATDIFCQSTTSIAGGGTSTFAIAVNVLSANGTSLTNRARVAGGGDPLKTQPADAATGVANAALCTANNTPVGCALDTDTVVAPNLQLTKTDSTTSVLEGGTSTYVLVVSNTGGTATVGTVRVVDVLPAGLTFSGASPFTVNGFTCTVTAPNIVCDRTTALAANSSASITFTVSVNSGAPSSVLNLAKVGGGGDPTPAKSTLPTTTTAAACAAPISPATTSFDANNGCAADINSVQYVRLQLSKDDGQAFVSQNGSTDYVFVVSNIGTIASAGTINFRDVLPGTMTMLGALATPFAPPGTNGADWSCTRISSTNIACTSTVSIPAGGSSSFFLTISVGGENPGVQQTNRARIGGGGDIRIGMINSPAVADVTACTTNGNPLGCAIDLNTVQLGPEVRMTKSHPNPQAKNPGDAFTFTLNLRNNGGTPAAINTVRMVDVVPAGLNIVSVVPSAPFTCAINLQVVTCNNTVAALLAGANVAVTVNVTVAAGATNALLNQAMIAATGDPQNSVLPTSVTAVICTGVDTPNFGCAADPVPLNADLQIVKLQRLGTSGTFGSAIVGVPLGTTVQYQISVTNSGPSNITALQVIDTVPTNFSTVSWVCTATGVAACSPTTGTGNAIALGGNINSGAGNSWTVVVTAVANNTTPIGGVTNTASITLPSGVVDTNLTNNTSSVPTAVGVTNLSITKTNGVTSLIAGQQTTYSIVVTNSGPTAADGARLYDPAVAGLSCGAPNPAPLCVASGANTTCPVGLTIAQLQNSVSPTGVVIPTLGSGGVITVTLVCRVTATGQ